MRHDHEGKDFVFGAMLGSTLGALTALMFTTKKGHKIQHDIMDKYHEFEKVVKHYAHGKTKRIKKEAKRVAKRVMTEAKKKTRHHKKKHSRKAKKR